MSNRPKKARPFAAVDYGALLLQRLRSEGRIDDQRLLRVDCRPEAKEAPFLFDAARGILHRNGCAAIAKSSHTALYAVWRVTEEDLELACKRCRPMPDNRKNISQIDLTDIVFGVMSVIDQFGAVLGQRGREFRGTDRGKAMERSFGSLLTSLDRNQKQGYSLALKTLETAINSISAYNEKLRRDIPETEKKSKNTANRRKRSDASARTKRKR
jgi:hypothetical protein